jgi:hypothetical protein
MSLIWLHGHVVINGIYNYKYVVIKPGFHIVIYQNSI